MDPMTGAALIGGAATLASGAFSASSQKKANAANVALSRENMAWQERMSNTAHQREAADLKAAGLNPVLSASGAGASSGSAQMLDQKSANEFSGLENAVHSSIEARRLKKEIDAVDSQVKLNHEQSETQKRLQSQAEANTAKSLQEYNIMRARMPSIESGARLEEAENKMNHKLLKFDSYLKRIRGVADGVSSAVDAINPLRGLMKKSPTGYSDEHYDGHGEHRSTKSRKYHYDK